MTYINFILLPSSLDIKRAIQGQAIAYKTVILCFLQLSLRRLNVALEECFNNPPKQSSSNYAIKFLTSPQLIIIKLKL